MHPWPRGSPPSVAPVFNEAQHVLKFELHLALGVEEVILQGSCKGRCSIPRMAGVQGSFPNSQLLGIRIAQPLHRSREALLQGVGSLPSAEAMNDAQGARGDVHGLRWLHAQPDHPPDVFRTRREQSNCMRRNFSDTISKSPATRTRRWFQRPIVCALAREALGSRVTSFSQPPSPHLLLCPALPMIKFVRMCRACHSPIRVDSRVA